jgi:hypothetical protein
MKVNCQQPSLDQRSTRRESGTELAESVGVTGARQGGDDGALEIGSGRSRLAVRSRR